jgi:predicted GNAT family N-acyltransferase
MILDLIINEKNNFNKKIYELFEHNFISDIEYQYNCILFEDYYFILYDQLNNNIIAECSVSIENKNIYEINNVLVEEKYRGNNYSVLLILNVLHYFEQQNKNVLIKICAENNSNAYYCYKKIFDQYKQDTKYTYFSHKI